MSWLDILNVFLILTSVIDILLGVCILVCVISYFFAQRVNFSLHGRDGVSGSDELILHMSECSDGGSLGEGGRGATTPRAETERGSVARQRHGVSLWLIMAGRHHGAGGGPHTGHCKDAGESLGACCSACQVTHYMYICA